MFYSDITILEVRIELKLDRKDLVYIITNKNVLPGINLINIHQNKKRFVSCTEVTVFIRWKSDSAHTSCTFEYPGIRTSRSFALACYLEES